MSTSQTAHRFALALGRAMVASVIVLLGLGAAASASALPAELEGSPDEQCAALLPEDMVATIAGWGTPLTGSGSVSLPYGSASTGITEFTGLSCTTPAFSFSVTPVAQEVAGFIALDLAAASWARLGPWTWGMGGRVYAEEIRISEGTLYRTYHFVGDGFTFPDGTAFGADDLRDAYLAAEGAGATTTPSASPPGRIAPLACDALVTPEALQGLLASGMILLEPTGEDAFTPRGGTWCQWVYWASEGGASYGYSPIEADDAEGEIARLEAAGFAREDTPEGVWLRFQPPFNGLFDPAPEIYFIEDGYWYYASTEESIGAMRAGVAAAVSALPPPPTATAVAAPAADPGGDPPPPFDADTPSVLSSLRTIQDADVGLAAVTATGLLAVIFAALVGLPGKLIESTISAHHERLARPIARLLSPARRLRAAVSGTIGRLPRGLLLAVGLVVAGLIACFSDPRFGWNEGSLRLFGSYLVTFVIDGLVAVVLVAGLMRRRGERATVTLRASALLVLIAAVVGTRLTGFEPGVVFGVILAVAYAPPPAREREFEATALELGYLLALGVLAWLGYSALVGLGGSDPGVGLLFAAETLGGLCVGALSALPLLLLPVRGLAGAVLAARSWWVWAGAFVVAGAAFVFVVMPVPAGWDVIDLPLATWTAFFVVYALLALLFWAWMNTARVAATHASAVPDRAE